MDNVLKIVLLFDVNILSSTKLLLQYYLKTKKDWTMFVSEIAEQNKEAKINWRFETEGARTKLKHLCPKLEY